MAVIELTEENFDQEVLMTPEIVLVDFWATWCGPCKMMAPVMDEIAEERVDVKVCKVNVDEQIELARKYMVLSVPTFLVFKDGQQIGKETGAVPKKDLLKLL